MKNILLKINFCFMMVLIFAGGMVSFSFIHTCPENSAACPARHKQRLPVAFPHDMHMESFDCETCHHDYDDKKNNVLAFAEKNGNKLISSENGFHAWIVVKDWVIDFTAPVFPNMLKRMDENASCEPKMFQKPLSVMCPSSANLKSNGDFFLHEDIPFANDMLDHFSKRPFNTDIADICCKWYRRPPRKMLKSITIGDGAGKLKQVPLRSYRISGSW